MDRRTLPRSSTPRSFTFTLSPSLTTSLTLFTRRDASWLVHISQLASRRVNKVSDVVKEGDKVKVKLLGVDERGKVRLSMKAVDQATGEDIEGKQGGDQPQAAQGGAAE